MFSLFVSLFLSLRVVGVCVCVLVSIILEVFTPPSLPVSAGSLGCVYITVIIIIITHQL